MHASPKNPNSLPGEQTLSAEQQHALENGPGMVHNPAAAYLITAEERLRRFELFDDYNLGNFHMYFNNSDFSQRAYHIRAHYQRFAIIYPELTERLNALTEQAGTQASLYFDDYGKAMADAWDKMRDCVDLDDPYVVQDGEVYRDFLAV